MTDNKEHQASAIKMDINAGNLQQAQDWIKNIAEFATNLNQTLSCTVKIKNTPGIHMEIPPHENIEDLLLGHKSKLESISPGSYAVGPAVASSPAEQLKR